MSEIAGLRVAKRIIAETQAQARGETDNWARGYREACRAISKAIDAAIALRKGLTP